MVSKYGELARAHEAGQPLISRREASCMSVIASVKISGFWGDRDVHLDLHDEVNFLIGQNGSGKTTAINIIAAAMTVDMESLERLPFAKIEISLYNQKTKRRPLIRVTKDRSSDTQYREIVYSIKETATGQINHYPIAHYSEERFFRDEQHARARSRSRIRRDHSTHLIKLLSELAQVSWLSVHRTTAIRHSSERHLREFTVDQKIHEINERLVRYFSELSVLSSSETRDFQRTLFLSLIEGRYGIAEFQSMLNQSVEGDQGALIDIYERFGVPESQYKKKAKVFFDILQELHSRTDNKVYDMEEVAQILNGWRVHSLVEEWSVTVDKEKKALKPRDTFVEILNRMFHRKSASILDNNELQFSTDSEKQLSAFELSSGEKQLYIIFAEALLQREKACIYIADEPELSLHISWQEVLVDSLRELNPRSQIVFATHSPDIVSHYSNRIIDMEEIVK